MLSLIAGVAFSAPISIKILPSGNVSMDSNQSTINFTTVVTGGLPFGPQKNQYIFQWSVAKGASCPGYPTLYPSQQSYLRYYPSATTSNCILNVLVYDYNGDNTTASTGVIAVNQHMVNYHSVNKTQYTIFQGQNAIISLRGPTGGTTPYHYQWLVSASLTSNYTAANANALCSVNPNTENCVFNTSASTPPGVYGFELSYWDSAYIPTILISDQVLVRVGPANAINGTITSKTTLSTTSSVHTTTTTSSASTSSVSTTSSTVMWTQKQVSSPGVVVSQAENQVKAWLKKILSYII